jgi:hypothetical protein
MSSITTKKLIYDAYRTLGVLRTGQTTSDDQIDDALRALNDLVDSWNIESLMIYSIEGTTYLLVAGLSTYTLGPGGTLGNQRPQRIDGAGLFYPNSTVQVPIPVLTLDRYRANQYGVYVDDAFPVANVYLNPAPQSGERLVLYDWVKLTGFADLDAAYDFPPGYAQCLRWNLAVQLAPMARIHAKIPDVLYDRIEAEAIKSKAAVKSFNSSLPPELSADDGGALRCGCNFNIYTGL